MMILQEASGRSVDRVGARPTIISREMVIATDNHVGLEVGRRIADYSWPKVRAHFDGTARVRD